MVLAVLTGIGLSASAGLNAYIPLLVVGLLGRYTGLIDLPPSWHWLANGWTLSILGVLLAIEVVADKVPALDSVNDVIHTVIRPTAGGLAFGAASQSQTVTADPGSFFSGHQWVPVAAGVVIALVVHGTKATARPVINVSTLGAGGPVVSVLEDVVSTVTSLVAVVLPVLIVVFLIGFVWFAFWVRRRRRERKARKAAQRAARQAAAAVPPGWGLAGAGPAVSGPPAAPDWHGAPALVQGQADPVTQDLSQTGTRRRYRW